MNKTDLKLKFVSWFHMKHPGKYCWADCVSWAFSKRWNPYKIKKTESCAILSKGIYQCDCGCYVNGVCWDKMSQAQRDRILVERQEQWEALEKPPF